MSKFKLAITFGIGFIISVITSLVVSNMILDGVTDSKVIVIVNSLLIIVLTSLINITVYIYIVNKVKEDE